MIFYVCFDEKNGAIQKVSNEPDVSLSNLEIDKETYVKFIQGTISLNDHLVIIQPRSLEKYKIIKKENQESNELINYSIKPFEKSENILEKNVFYIIEDRIESCWKITANLEKDYETFLINSKNYTGYDKHIYITQEGNPNRLYGKLIAPIDKFFEYKEFTIGKIDSTITQDLSLYASVTHEKYMHIIRNSDD